MRSLRGASRARLYLILACLAPLTGVLYARGADATLDLVRYRGMCDASAAVAIGDGHFLVADDEQNTLKLYSGQQAPEAVGAFPWDLYLNLPVDDKPLEADIEGATRLGDNLLWISSHGRNLSGKWRPSRHQFFALQVTKTDGSYAVKPIGQSYRRLALDLVEHPALQGLGLAEALGSPEEKDGELAPKEDGFNIEGLTATPDGKSVLIGFRNPLPQGNGLLIPLLNPMDVITQSAKPEFGTPILLRLHVRLKGEIYQLGIRSIEYSPQHSGYLIAAGPPDGQDVFAIYWWSGVATDRPQLLPATASVLRQSDFAPEAIVVYSQQSDVQLLSDDGTTVVPVRSRKECQKGAFKNGKCEQKFLLDDQQKSFGSLRLTIESPSINR